MSIVKFELTYTRKIKTGLLTYTGLTLVKGCEPFSKREYINMEILLNLRKGWNKFWKILKTKNWRNY